jgi:hypothetical protein
MRPSIHIPACLFLLGGTALCQNASFYKEAPLFSTAPAAEKSVNTIERFGPVGMAIELHQPAFTMWVGTIEPGSPAEATGMLKKGQIIESINGQALKDIDPRIQLGQILEAAEATDGIVKFAIKDMPAPVVVKIPVLGGYSKTWPLNCPKSDKIVRNFAAYLKQPKSNQGFADIGMLFLLSTGDEGDLTAVRDWVHGLKGKKTSAYAWHIGYGGLALCEYYLRTGDAEALPVIQNWVDAAAKGEYLDAWAGRGGVVKLGYGNGHLNAGGTHVVTFLLLAKQCGAEVNDSLLHRTLVHFFRYAGRGSNPYGDDRPEVSFVDNGKNGKLAFAMAAAASLTPEGESSIYAKARDQMAMTGFYTTTFMLHGHTGGGIGEIWRSAAMNLLPDKNPLQYREFMDHRKWHYDLSRRHDGSFAILGGAGYDKEEWGAGYALTYTVPRKTLRITGAPPSKFSKTYQLPKRPWGTEADDVFVSLEPVADKDGKRMDVSGEILTKDSAKPLIIRLNEKELGDDEIRRYLQHPDYLVRNMVSLNAAGLSCDYMFPKPGQRVRPELLEESARHDDPRVRNAGIRAAIKAFDPTADWSKRLFDIAIGRLKDDKESWFVKDACLSLVARGTPDMIVPQVDVILPYLKHPEQWLQHGALMVLTNVATDERCAEKVLPPMGELFQSTPRQSTTSGPSHALREKLPAASPKVRDLALKAMGGAYQNYSGAKTWEGGQDLTGHRKDTLEMLAATLTGVPGGYDMLYQLAKHQYPGEPLPHDGIFLAADPEKFGPELKKAIQPLIREKLIYQYIGQNRRAIFNDIDNKTQRGSVTNTIDGLVDLYQKVGVRDYDWKVFGPDLIDAKWHYFTFDPPEKQKYDLSPWRYRPVTYPKGMENWFAPDFDPAKAGWKTGQFPIGQFNGKLVGNRTPVTRPDTIWPDAPRSLWENEVLLVNGTFDLPPLKPDHLYRLRVQTGQGVGAGDGFKVYINGNAIVETKEGLGRRAGLTVRGGWITPEIGKDFGKAPVTIAATSFLRYGDRAIVQMPPVPQGTFTLWLEERKLPPLDPATLAKAATFVPMLSAEWQRQNDPENGKSPTSEDAFQYDGRFIANSNVPGSWTTVAQVNAVEDFDPQAKPNPGRSPLKNIRFHDNGTTDSPNWIWSGDTLMDLDHSQALKITPRSIHNSDYLFIESGGFGPKNPATWQCPLMVLKRN